MVAVTTPRAGQYFNVKRDGRYINAQIVRNASHKKVQVMYLDTRNTSYVPLHDLWSLKGPRLAALKKRLEKEKKEKEKEKKESAPTLPVPVPYASPQELTQQDVPQAQEQTLRTVKIVPTRYKPGHVLGDFGRMLEDPMYTTTGVMLFNDNREQWRDRDLWPGGGNAIARPAQAEYKSIGMPTGSHGHGFTSLNQEHDDNETTRDIIDTAIARTVKLFVDHTEKDTLYYSVNPNAPEDSMEIGTSIFRPEPEVLSYITKTIIAFPKMFNTAVQLRLNTFDDIYATAVTGVPVPLEWTKYITMVEYNRIRMQLRDDTLEVLNMAYGIFPKGIAVHILQCKGAKFVGDATAARLNDLFARLNHMQDAIRDIQAFAAKRRWDENWCASQEVNPDPQSATEVPAEWKAYATLEQYQKLTCVFGDSPFRKSLLDVAYLNYPKGLQIIMLSHFTLDARVGRCSTAFTTAPQNAYR